MDKGIRPAARAKFVELNELRRRGVAPYTGPKANTVFRKEIIFFLIEQFGISVASAATHYNEAFKLVKSATPELVSGLGRAEDKKGGRKPRVKAPVDAGTVLSTGIKPNTATHTVGVNPEAEYTEPQQTVFTVKKKSDGTVIAEGLSFEDAKALVAKAAAAKKAKLYWV